MQFLRGSARRRGLVPAASAAASAALHRARCCRGAATSGVMGGSSSSGSATSFALAATAGAGAAAGGNADSTAATHVAEGLVPFDSVEVEKPLSDYRQYRLAQLSNNLPVLLISDAKCDRAAAALSVQVGSIFDPKEIQGLAHFCEHMLFLGTEKFPKESEYNEYLAKNGGSSNAYTAETVTNYFFGVKPEALGGALDRFAQFFVAPLFTESATERELQAVDSEHSKNLQQDGWRQTQLLRNAAHTEHPLHHFMTGNSETLRDAPARHGVDVRAALLDFHAQYYSANLMRLVVVGREEPNQLLKMAQTHFTPILDRAASVPLDAEIGAGIEAFPPDLRARIVHVVPVNDVRSAAFQFVVPGQKVHWRSKPARYLAHLIGHEGRGSLLAALKRRGLATELSAGEALDEAGVGIFSVSVVLTKEGEANIDIVGDLLFAYISLLRSHGPDEHLWRELQQIADLGFRFRSLSDSVSIASSLAHSWQEFEPEFMMSGAARIWEYEPAHIEDLLQRLRCSNLRLVLNSKSYADKCTLKERWYGTQYSDEPLDTRLHERWSKDSVSQFDDLAVPAPNPFVPADLLKRPAEAASHPEVPEILQLQFTAGPVHADRIATAFFRKDEQFGLPKAVCAFQLYCPYARDSVEHRCLAELWCLAIREELNEFAYDATVAGLSYSLQATATGMVLSVSGYNDKLPDLLKAVAHKMAQFHEVPTISYDIARTILERNLTNAAKRSPPYRQAFTLEHCTLNIPAHSLQERLAAVRAVTDPRSLSGICRKLLDHCHVECLLQGNLTTDEARGLVQSFLEPLGIVQPLDALPPRGTAALPAGWTLVEREGTHAEELNGAVLATLQVAEENLQNRALINLVGQVLSQRFFDDLRTKQQLGYIVSASPYSELDAFVGLRLIVQSERPPTEVARRVREWSEGAWEHLEQDLTEAEFDEYRAALIASLRERPMSLGEEFGNNWAEVGSRGFTFKRREIQAAHLETLTLGDLRLFVTEKLRSASAILFLIKPGTESSEAAEEALGDRRWTQEDILHFRQSATWRLCDASLAKKSSAEVGRSRL